MWSGAWTRTWWWWVSELRKSARHNSLISIVLQLPGNYQGRVQASLECLEVPDWYRQSSQPPLHILHTSTPPSTTPSWRSPPATTSSAASSYKSSSQWRLQQQKTEATNPVRPARNYATSYSGWRSTRSNKEAQKNLLVTNPSQRLAKTIIDDIN